MVHTFLNLMLTVGSINNVRSGVDEKFDLVLLSLVSVSDSDWENVTEGMPTSYDVKSS